MLMFPVPFCFFKIFSRIPTSNVALIAVLKLLKFGAYVCVAYLDDLIVRFCLHHLSPNVIGQLPEQRGQTLPLFSTRIVFENHFFVNCCTYRSIRSLASMSWS